MIEHCIARGVCCQQSRMQSVAPRTLSHIQEALMFAQTYSFQADPSQTEAVSQFVKHVVVPDIQRQHGFKGLQALVDRQSGKGQGISYWETEADARAAATAAA